MDAEKEVESLLEVISTLSKKIDKDTKADEALKFTQAMLNAANTIRCLANSQFAV